MSNTLTNVTRRLEREFRRFVIGIKNLYSWFSTIWWDRDWDYGYLDKMILVKLERMAKSFEEDSNLSGSAFNAERIRWAHDLLSLVAEDYYYMEYTQYYEQDFNLTEEGVLKWIEPATDNLGLFFDKYPRIYKEAVQSLSSEKYSAGHSEIRFKIAIIMCDINQKRARKLAYNIISTYSPQWWD